MSKYRVFSGPYFPVFGLNTEIYEAPTPQNGQTHSNNLPTKCLSVFDHFVGLTLRKFRIQSEYKKIRIRKNSKFGHFPENLSNIFTIRVALVSL